MIPKKDKKIIELYLDYKLSPNKISKIIGIHQNTIRYRLIINDVKMRTLSESLKGRKLSKETKEKVRKSKLGHIPWNKGGVGVYNIETLESMKVAHLGKRLSEKHKRNIGLASKGRKHTTETKRKLSLARKNVKRQPLSKEWKEKIKQSCIGKKDSYDTRVKKSLAMTGKDVFNGFLTNEYAIIRKSGRYYQWRKQVKKRDNYVCQNTNCRYCNNISGKQLHSHHIIPMKECLALDWEEGIFDIDNGLTLCKNYHQKTHGLLKIEI